MRWLLRHHICGWEHFNMQFNLLVASLYNVVCNFIQTFHLFMSLCLTINAFIFVFHLNMSSFQTSYGLSEQSSLAQLLLSHFSSPSEVPLCLSPWDISLAPWHSSPQFSQSTFSTQYLHLSRGVSAFCWLTLPYCSPPSNATGHNFRENYTCKWAGLGLYWFYLAGPHRKKKNILLALYHIIL